MDTSPEPQHPFGRTDDGDVLASPPRRRPSRGLVAGGVGLFLAGAALSATGLASAADSPSPAVTPSPTSPSAPDESPQARERDGQRPGKGRGPGGHGLRGGLGLHGPKGALHGEFVAPKAEGGTQTFLVQRGEATAVSADSLTVKSSDGFTRTYAVSADAMVHAHRDGLASIKVGDEVRVLATLDGTTARALRVADITQRKAQRERLLPERERNAPAPGDPAPSRPSPGGTAPGSPAPDSSTEGSGSDSEGTFVPA